MKRTTTIYVTAALLAFLLGFVKAPTAVARLRLVALPDRDNIIVNLDNPNVALVQEERVLTLQEGINQIDFSWKGVKIDESSIRFRPLTEVPDELMLLSVSYPPGEDALVWEVRSPAAMDARVRIIYLLDGIDQIVTYTAVADRGETEVELLSYLVLRNFSGEDFEHARWLLGYGDPFDSVSRHQETKRVTFFRKSKVPITKEFTWDAAKMPHEPDREDGAVGIPVHYAIANTAEANLGEHMLWPGKARVFQDDGHATTIFLGEDLVPFTPVGDEFRLYIGNSRDIVVTQRRLEARRENIRRNNNRQIVLYDEVRTDNILVENFRDRGAVLNMIQHMEGQWEMLRCDNEYEKLDYKTIQLPISMDAETEIEIQISYRVKNIVPLAAQSLIHRNLPHR